MYQSVLSLRIRACFNMRAILLLNTKKNLDHQSTTLPNGTQLYLPLGLSCKRNKQDVSTTEDHYDDFYCSGNIKKKKKASPFFFTLQESVFKRQMWQIIGGEKRGNILLSFNI